VSGIIWMAHYLWKPLLCPVESADNEAEPAVADLVREPDQHRRVRLDNNTLRDEHLKTRFESFTKT